MAIHTTWTQDRAIDRASDALDIIPELLKIIDSLDDQLSKALELAEKGDDRIVELEDAIKDLEAANGALELDLEALRAAASGRGDIV